MNIVHKILAAKNIKTILTLFTTILEKEYSFILKEMKGFLHGHPELIRYIAQKSQIPETEVEEQLDHYVTVLVISVIGGWHLGKKINHLEGVRGALVGAGAGSSYLAFEHIFQKFSGEGDIHLMRKISEVRA